MNISTQEWIFKLKSPDAQGAADDILTYYNGYEPLAS